MTTEPLNFQKLTFEPQEPSIFGDRYAPSVYNRASVAGGFWTGIGGVLFLGIIKWDPFLGGIRNQKQAANVWYF